MDPLVALAPLAGILVNMAAHVGGLRLARLGFYHAALAGFAAGGALVLALSLAASGRLTAGDAAAGGLLAGGGYLGLSFGYFIFVNLSRTSVHIRILRELHAAPGHELPLAELLGRYGADHVLEARLERLLANGQVVCVGDRYESGPRSNFLLLARVLDVFKLALLGKRTLFRPRGTPPRRPS